MAVQHTLRVTTQQLLSQSHIQDPVSSWLPRPAETPWGCQWSHWCSTSLLQPPPLRLSIGMAGGRPQLQAASRSTGHCAATFGACAPHSYRFSRSVAASAAVAPPLTVQHDCLRSACTRKEYDAANALNMWLQLLQLHYRRIATGHIHSQAGVCQRTVLGVEMHQLTKFTKVISANMYVSAATYYKGSNIGAYV